ncbi:MAG TPA: glycosyltransferase family 39 protein [Nitrospirota bacterium]|nr:glycosyltransferase family 39 protein [Nitrospirota bacterium]
MQKMQEQVDRLFASKRYNLFAFIIIAALTLIAYSNTFTAAFHFDDNPSIVENGSIRHFTWDSIVGQFSGTRPIVNLSLLFNYQLSGMNVIGWHVFNIGLHIANSIFVYLFLLWTLNLPSLSARYGGVRAKRMALFGSLLFALHPVQTESVTYIISRTELLATFFYLATFLFFIKGVRSRKFSYYIGCFFMSFLAMGSKEWAVTLPAMLFIYDFLFIAEGKLQTVLTRSMAYILVALPWGFVAYNLTSSKLSGAGFGISGQNGLTPWTYWLTSFNVMWTYIRLLILPINQNLDYSYTHAMTLFEFPTLLSLLGHICIVAASLWLYVKRKLTLLPFGAAWFYITLSPTQSFVPILDVIFEHRLYLPSIGFFIVFILLFEGVFEWFEKKKALKSATAVS